MPSSLEDPRAGLGKAKAESGKSEGVQSLLEQTDAVVRAYVKLEAAGMFKR